MKNDRSNVDIRTRPRIPIPDEDPYSIAGNIQADPIYLYLKRTPTGYSIAGNIQAVLWSITLRH